LVKLSEGGFAKKQCLHCLEPGCVDACPAGAIRKTAEGPVVYDRDQCMGCRYCMLACPVGIPRYEWDQVVPYMKKCDLCHERVSQGEPTACADACPNGAIRYGERDELLALARSRISQSRGKYLSHIYGEKELGGTCVLYISGEPLERLGWPERVGNRSLATFTWPVISKTPWMAAGVAGLLIATHLVIKRRMEVQAAARDEAHEGAKDEAKDGAKENADQNGEKA
jgi:formate dehydrogenase iron-sulfur subunit